MMSAPPDQPAVTAPGCGHELPPALAGSIRTGSTVRVASWSCGTAYLVLRSTNDPVPGYAKCARVVTQHGEVRGFRLGDQITFPVRHLELVAHPEPTCTPVDQPVFPTAAPRHNNRKDPMNRSTQISAPTAAVLADLDAPTQSVGTPGIDFVGTAAPGTEPVKGQTEPCSEPAPFPFVRGAVVRFKPPAAPEKPRDDPAADDDERHEISRAYRQTYLVTKGSPHDPVVKLLRRDPYGPGYMQDPIRARADELILVEPAPEVRSPYESLVGCVTALALCGARPAQTEAAAAPDETSGD